MSDRGFIRLRIFTCTYARDSDASVATPQGPTLGDQVTEFFHNEDAWPLGQSVSIAPSEFNDNGEELITHIFTLSWLPREEYVIMQAQIQAKAKMILDDQLSILSEEPEHG